MAQSGGIGSKLKVLQVCVLVIKLARWRAVGRVSIQDCCVWIDLIEQL